MPTFSKRSQSKLNTCEMDLQILFDEVVKHFDCTVISGHRTPEEQYKLFKQRPKVTNLDGYKLKSKHNEYPSQAIDVVPYPIDWDNVDRMKMFIGYVLGTAQQLKSAGIISHRVISGIDWDNDTLIRDHDFLDHPHFEVVL